MFHTPPLHTLTPLTLSHPSRTPLAHPSHTPLTHQHTHTFHTPLTRLTPLTLLTSPHPSHPIQVFAEQSSDYEARMETYEEKLAELNRGLEDTQPNPNPILMMMPAHAWSVW